MSFWFMGVGINAVGIIYLLFFCLETKEAKIQAGSNGRSFLFPDSAGEPAKGTHALRRAFM